MLYKGIKINCLLIEVTFKCKKYSKSKYADVVYYDHCVHDFLSNNLSADRIENITVADNLNDGSVFVELDDTIYDFNNNCELMNFNIKEFLSIFDLLKKEFDKVIIFLGTDAKNIEVSVEELIDLYNKNS